MENKDPMTFLEAQNKQLPILGKSPFLSLHRETEEEGKVICT